MDPSTILQWLVAFGAGGVVANWISESTDRRRMRADLLAAQQALNSVEYRDLEAFSAALEGLRRQAMVSGVPQWLIRHYGGIAGLELGERRREQEIPGYGERERHDSSRANYAVTKIPRQRVAELYRDIERKFNWGIWHPALVRLAVPFWRWRFNRFAKRIGFGALSRSRIRSHRDLYADWE